MPGIGRQNRRYNKNPSRRKIPGVGAQTYRGQRTEILVASVVVGNFFATVTFDQPVSLKGVPQWERQDGAMPTGVTINSTNTEITLSYAPAVVPASVEVPFEEPAVRNQVGGYVRPGVYEPAP